MTQRILDLDKRDMIIVKALQKSPEMSQEEIGKLLKLSQPSVSARLRRLKTEGVISHIVGIDFKKVRFNMAKVDINTSDTQGLIKEFEHCPSFLNALVVSGRYNLCVFLVGNGLIKIEEVIDHHLRKNNKVKDMEVSIVVDPAKELILPITFDPNTKKQQNCSKKCNKVLEEIKQ